MDYGGTADDESAIESSEFIMSCLLYILLCLWHIYPISVLLYTTPQLRFAQYYIDRKRNQAPGLEEFTVLEGR